VWIFDLYCGSGTARVIFYMEKEPRNTIQSVGEYLTVDQDGYIQNELSLDNIQDKWEPVIEDTISAYKNHFGKALVAVYIRGSVAKGKAIDGVSDLDNIAIVNIEESEINLDWRHNFIDTMKIKYPFIDDVEIVVVTLKELKTDHNTRMFLKTQGLNVYGQDLTTEIPDFKLGIEMVAHSLGLERSITSIEEFLKQSNEPELIKTRCKVIMKRIIRTGFEIVMERDQTYTRDIYLCWETFSKYYPEKSQEMYRALELAISPTENAHEIETVINGIGKWLVKEVQKVFPNSRG